MLRRTHLAFILLFSLAVGPHGYMQAQAPSGGRRTSGLGPRSSDVGLRSIDAAVQRAMTAFDVPGISLAIVKDGRVVVAKGYGVRKLGDTAAVDAKTLFG